MTTLADINPAELAVTLQRLLAERSLLDFITYTNKSYVVDPVHRYVANQLQDFAEQVAAGRAPRLMIFMPPQSGKSTLVSRYFPAWVLGNHPDWRIGIVSHGAGWAEELSQDARNIVRDNERYAEVFPEIVLDPESTSKADWRLAKKEGSVRAIGVGGSITGKSFDILIGDDLVKGRAEADSATYRAEQIAWWPQAMDRVQEVGGIIIVCTRWHYQDIAGYLIQQGKENPDADQWRVISLTALAEEHDPLGRVPGEALAPHRHSLAKLRNFRANMPDRDWQAKFMQRPSADEGAIFKRDWLRFEDEPENTTGTVFQAADTAFKATQSSDYSCVTTWRIEPTGYRLLHVYRARAEFPQLRAAMVDLAERWNPTALLVEDKASGQSIIQELRAQTRLPVLPWKPDGDKQARAHAVTPLFESKRVVFPKSAPWLQAYVEELTRFPVGEHDDQVDSTSMALSYASTRYTPARAPSFESFTLDADMRPKSDDSGLYEQLGIAA